LILMKCAHHPGRVALVLTVLFAISASPLIAATLTDAAVKAYGEYLDRARRAFVARVSQPVWKDEAERSLLRKGQTVARPAEGDGIQSKPDSLIHNWRAAVFIEGATLDASLSVSRSYGDYPSIFHPVIASKVLSHEGDTFSVQFRMRQSAGGLTSTLDMWPNIRYTRVDATHAFVLSTIDTIREVEDAGKPTEHYGAAGHDSGYLWRGATLTRFVEADGGVYMEMETIGLSRSFPPLLGWLIEPIARRVGRGSVENSVQEFRQAVLKRRSA
jgi:hypothetical protein